MTVEDIKDKYNMTDITSMYGLRPNHAGFISCPFHTGDRQASLKVYKSDFYCFGCGAHGDIFDFVQLMDHLTFKEAFESLGGTYAREGNGFAQKLAIYKRQKAAEHRKAQEQQQKDRLRQSGEMIARYRDLLNKAMPMTDEWADAYNRLQLAIYKDSQLTGIEW